MGHPALAPRALPALCLARWRYVEPQHAHGGAPLARQSLHRCQAIA